MTIYVDEVFLLNTLVNWFLLKTARTLTGSGGRPWRLWAAALLGGLYAVAVLLPGARWLGSLGGRSLGFLALCAAAYAGERMAWRAGLWFFGVCCAFGGITLAVTALLGTPVLYRGGRVYYQLSLRLLILLAGALYALCRLALPRFARHRGGELVRLELRLGAHRASCLALRDSGNTLTDPLTGEQVAVAGCRLGRRLLPELGLSPALLADPAQALALVQLCCPGAGARLIPYRAVGTGRGLLLALRPDEITQNGRPARLQLLALSPNELSDGGAYEAVVPGG